MRRDGTTGFSWKLTVGLLAGAAATAMASARPAAPTLLIDRVAVVDAATGRVLPDRAVVIKGGTIVRVARAGSVRAGAATRRIDGRGLFVAPGYNDMHAHNLNTASPATSLPVMLAGGVTGFRQMAGSPQLLEARARSALPLGPDTPALLAMPGAILAGPAFASPAAVTAEVARQKAQGADFIKVVDVGPTAFAAAAAAAKEQGLPFAGHLPPTVDTRTAMAEGMASLEHLGPGISLLLNCSRDEAPIRAMLAKVPADASNIDFSLPPAQLARRLANPMLLQPPPVFLVMRRVMATYDDAKCRAFAADVAKSGTWMVPTLTRLEAMNLGNAGQLRDSPDLAYVPADVRTMWRDVGADFDARLTPDQRGVLADLFAAQLRLTKLFADSGVKMLTGTDFGGQWIPPAALHREFDLMAQAGVPPAAILRMATIDAARFLRREDRMGAVAAGRDADLVLLSGDPTRSVAGLHAVVGVVRAGRYIDKAGLEEMRKRAAAALR